MGCMQLVGEAFKENSLSIDPSLIVPVLGIGNWCTAANYESLIRPKVIKRQCQQKPPELESGGSADRLGYNFFGFPIQK